MDNHLIRKCNPSDELQVEGITFRTGYNGEDLTGRHYFDDRRLFFYLFSCYYIRYEPENSFVVEDVGAGRLAGYIIGTLDTRLQEVEFEKRMMTRILSRAFLYTSWRYPRTFATLLKLSRMAGGLKDDYLGDDFFEKYPAHLHMNLLPEYQGKGLGTLMMRYFEDHLRGRGIGGVHLQTSNYNHKALPFYEKMGFHRVKDVRLPHPVIRDYSVITFAKRLDGQERNSNHQTSKD
jgi:GNAT superfamily N-acetyltransferase